MNKHKERMNVLAVLTNEELIKEYKESNDKFILNYIIKKNTNLVYDVLKKFKVKDLDFQEDLASIGLMSIYNSVEKFDETKAKFSTLCYINIRNSIIIELKREEKNKFQSVSELDYDSDCDNVLKGLNNLPNLRVDISEDDIKADFNVDNIVKIHSSLKLIYSDEEVLNELELYIDDIVEFEILTDYYFSNATLKSIGLKYGINRLNYKKKKLIKKMRKFIDNL